MEDTELIYKTIVPFVSEMLKLKQEILTLNANMGDKIKLMSEVAQFYNDKKKILDARTNFPKLISEKENSVSFWDSMASDDKDDKLQNLWKSISTSINTDNITAEINNALVERGINVVSSEDDDNFSLNDTDYAFTDEDKEITETVNKNFEQVRPELKKMRQSKGFIINKVQPVIF